MPKVVINSEALEIDRSFYSSRKINTRPNSHKSSFGKPEGYIVENDDNIKVQN